MSRMVSPTRRREGKGLGERLAELSVFAAALVGIFLFGRWYFVIYRNSPTVALMDFMGALKAGNVEGQYKKVASDTKKNFFPDMDTYRDKFKMAQGLTGRMSDYRIDKITETGNKAEADVTVPIRKSGQELYQAANTDYHDHYVMTKESDGWKVVLDKSDIKSQAGASGL